MKTSLIEFIVCPICLKKFSLKKEKKSRYEILEGILQCSNGHKFKIHSGIPRLLVDKTKGFVKTEEAFSSKWKKYYKTYQSNKWYNYTQKWFLDRFGWKNISNFNKFLKSRHYILDAGTGIGNSAKRFSVNPKSQVYAIDASESIDFAYKKYGKISNIHFIQADLRQIPFKKKFFDFICADQVLHHTKNTETSFKYLTKYLQKNGLISIYVYNKKGPIREFVDDFIRKKTTIMLEKDCLQFSKNMAYLGKTLSDLKQKIRVQHNIPQLGIKAGTYDIQRFFYWNFLKCFWAEDGNFERSVGVNFDWYYPKFAWRHTPKEVKKWFKESGLQITYFKEIESGINVSGRK